MGDSSSSVAAPCDCPRCKALAAAELIERVDEMILDAARCRLTQERRSQVRALLDQGHTALEVHEMTGYAIRQISRIAKTAA